MKNYKIIFNPDKHEYWVNGVQYPCVSDIVKPLSIDYSKIHEDTLNHKRDLGKAFHHAIHLFLIDDLDEEDLQEKLPELIEPIKGFKEFWTEDEFKGGIQPEINEMRIEEKMYHPKLHYCGTPDFVISNTIYDWKFRKYDPIGDPLRMAAYEHLAGEPKQKVVVCFDREGCYRRHDAASNKNAWGMFRQCLEFYSEKKKFDELCDKWRQSIK